MTTLSTNADGETELTLVKGDSDDFLVTFTDDDDPPSAIDLSKAVDGTANRPAVVRFAVKQFPDEQANSAALIFKTSHFPDQVSLATQSGATLGQATVLVDSADTEDTGDVNSGYRWDVEIVRQGLVRTAAGTVSVVDGSDTVTGVGTDFTKAKKGDTLQLLGVLNQLKPVIITQVVSPTSVKVSCSVWVTEPGVAFDCRRGVHKTPARGPFALLSEVVAQ